VNKSYGDVSTPRVWETWKADYELFLPNGAKPAGWNSYDSPSPCDATTKLEPFRKYLTSFDKYHGYNQAGLKGPAGPLVTQNREYARYEIRVNNIEFHFIVAPPSPPYRGPLYLQENLPDKNNPLKFTDGSIEVKAVWRLMKDVPQEQRGRYYVTRAYLRGNPSMDTCTLTDVGLIGLHIVSKVQGFPQWIWSTFEHVDNVPALPGETGQGQPPYTLNNDSNTPPSPMGAPISNSNPPQKDPAPTQVVRVRPIAASTQRTNSAYHNAPGVKGTVWENYQLVMTQWPTTDKGQSTTFPNEQEPQPQTNTANVTAETWFQDSSSTSCMACHRNADNLGMDFVWFLRLGAYPPPAPAPAAGVQVMTSHVRKGSRSNPVRSRGDEAVSALHDFVRKSKAAPASTPASPNAPPEK
jgi:hypothetical protein